MCNQRAATARLRDDARRGFDAARKVYLTGTARRFVIIVRTGAGGSHNRTNRYGP